MVSLISYNYGALWRRLWYCFQGVSRAAVLHTKKRHSMGATSDQGTQDIFLQTLRTVCRGTGFKLQSPEEICCRSKGISAKQS